MNSALLVFAASAGVGTVLTPLIRDHALKRGLVDHALSSRKIHKTPIPRLGGIGIAAAFFLALIGLAVLDARVRGWVTADPLRTFGLLAGGLGIVALGIVDDIRGVRARHKLLGQLLVAALVYACGYRVDAIANPFGPSIQLGLLGLPFTMLWVAGVINALNLIDGLDGLAGGVAFLAATTTLAIAAMNGAPLMVLVAAALGGATLGFLFFNFNPASIFMGDTGSMFLGFVLATTAIGTHQTQSAGTAILIPILVLGIPIGDTLLSMGRRALRGVPMFGADRGHIHHRLLDRGLSQRQAVLVLYAFTAFLGLGAIALTLTSVSSSAAALVIGVLVAVVYLFLRMLGFFDLRRAPAMLDQRRRNLELRTAIRRIGGMLREAQTPWEVWVALRFAAAPLGAGAIALRLPETEGCDPLDFEQGFSDGNLRMLRARYGLAVERPGHHQVELGWTDGRKHVDRDTEVAIELLCEQMADAIERIERDNVNGNVIPFDRWRSTG
jgi:UDP-GlcNAc:undecaprenyl-phosphate/decaprenyl-phosphate GlcNAc-1-phosphate transferase